MEPCVLKEEKNIRTIGSDLKSNLPFIYWWCGYREQEGEI